MRIKIIGRNVMVESEECKRVILNEDGEIVRELGIVKYDRRFKDGEGFGKRKVGMKVKVKMYYKGEKYKEFVKRRLEGEWNLINYELEEGMIVRIVRRINWEYYDYWYKVKLDSGKYIWRSYIEV